MSSGPIPFPGLRPFQLADAEYFCGQDDQIEALYRRLDRSRFVTVMGVSGCGKSSLVRAGLMPQLCGEGVPIKNRWTVIVTRPGSDPVGNLARKLRQSLDPVSAGPDMDSLLRSSEQGLIEVTKRAGLPGDRRILIIVDQFEELFRYLRGSMDPRAEDEAAFFIKLLLEASRKQEAQTYVVTTMRSEYLENCSLFYGLAEAVNRGVFLLPRMSHDQCEQVIREPLEQVGATVSVPLVQTLLSQTEDQQDGLPLLQHALRRIWDHWSLDNQPDREVGMGDFDIKGGDERLPMVNRHLDDHLDKIFGDLTEASQQVAKCIFTLLSEWDEKGNAVRRPSTVQEVMDVSGADLATVRTVIGAFWQEGTSRTFLTAPDLEGGSAADLKPADAIDLSHECLMRQWRQLRKWMAAERENAGQLRRLGDAYSKQKREGLLSGPPLATLLEWRNKFHPSEAWAARYAVVHDPPTNDYRRELAPALVFLERSRKSERWRTFRRWLYGIVPLTLAVIAFAYLSLQETAVARAEANAAEARAKLASSMASEAAALENQARSRASAAEATLAVAEANAKAQKAAHNAEIATLTAMQSEERDKASRTALAQSVKNEAAAEANTAEAKKNQADAEANTAEAKKNEANARAEKDKNDKVANVNAIQEAKLLAHSKIDNVVSLVSQGKNREALAYLAYALRKDGESVAAKSWIFDLMLRGGFRKPDKPYTNEIFSAGQQVLFSSFSHDGARVVAACWDGTFQIWDVATGAKIATMTVPNSKAVANSATFSRDGGRVVTASSDKVARIWDAKNGHLIRELKGHADAVTSAAFSPDGDRVVTASWDNTAIIWDANSGAILTSLKGHSGPVTSAVFSSDGKVLVTASWDKTAMVWDAATGRPIRRMAGYTGRVSSAEFSPDGDFVVTASDRIASVWDTVTGLPTGNFLRHDAGVNWAAFSPEKDGLRIVTASGNAVQLWERGTGTAIGAPLKLAGRASSAFFSPDGRSVLTTSYDGKVQICPVWLDFDNPALLAEMAEAVAGYTYEPEKLTLIGDQPKRLADLATHAVGNGTTASFVRSFLSWR